MHGARHLRESLPVGQDPDDGWAVEWRRDAGCYLRYARINDCPRAISQIRSKSLLRSYTGEKERYPHPHATADGIAEHR